MMKKTMKKVLIATTNKDKYKSFKSIFMASIFPQEKYLIQGLNDLNIKINDSIEVGSNIQRAKTKALNAKNTIKDFDYVVGIDIAILVKGQAEPNIKNYIKDIIDGTYFKENEKFYFSSAYCIIDKDDNCYEMVNDVPFVYKSNHNAIIKEHSYPLNQIAYPLKYDKCLDDLTIDEQSEYYLKYMKSDLENLNIK